MLYNFVLIAMLLKGGSCLKISWYGPIIEMSKFVLDNPIICQFKLVGLRNFIYEPCN